MSSPQKNEWLEVARRLQNQPVLLIDLMAHNFADGNTSKALGTNFKIRYYRQFDKARWLSRKDINRYIQLLRTKETKNPGYFLSLAFKMQQFEKDFLKLCQKLNKQKFNHLNNLKLADIFKKFLETNKLIVCLDYTYILLNKFYPDLLVAAVAKKVPDFETQNRYLKILFTADKESETRKEKEALLKIVQKVKKSGFSLVVRKLIKTHTKKYAHLGMYIFLGRPYSERDIKKRIKYLLKKNLATDFIELKQQKAIKNDSLKIIKELKLDKKEILLIKTIKEWAYAIQYLEESWNKGLVLAKPLIDEVLKRLSLKWEEWREMQSIEIIRAARIGKVTKELRKKIRLRQKDNTVLMIGRRIKVLEGEALRRYYQKEKLQKKDFSEVRELRGQPASAGLAVGPVRLILNQQNINKFLRGEILVAPSTTPMHVPAMEKAKAIVTDEGGLLSHAAIVSRELKVPCIVGTKIGTKVLNDGDLVEVDATKGVVKKVN